MSQMIAEMFRSLGEDFAQSLKNGARALADTLGKAADIAERNADAITGVDGDAARTIDGIGKDAGHDTDGLATPDGGGTPDLSGGETGAGSGRPRDPKTGRFVADPDNPPSPYTFTDADRRKAWKALADDPDSGL